MSDHNLLVGAGVGDQGGVSVLQEGGDGVELDDDLIDAEVRSRPVGVVDPVPERETEVEAAAAVRWAAST